MAHDSNNKKIYIGATGVEIADVQVVLGLPNTDIGALITQGASLNKINKWAKFKPVRYYTVVNSNKIPYPGLLTGDMWKGANIEQNEGAYYGIEVRVAGNQQVTPEMNTWPLLHDTTFNYRAPRGLSNSEFFRLRDFEGYNQDAKPNPFASFGNEGSATGYYQYENGISGITVRYTDPNPPAGQTGNTDGVDLTGVLIDSNESTTDALEETYPCIIVGKGNTHYITALGFEDDPNHAPRPVYYQNAFVGGTWVANTNKPVFDIGGHITTPPWTSAQTGLSATVVLLRSAYVGSGNRITLDVTGNQDLATHWFECILDSSIAPPKAPVPMPGAVNVSLDLIAFESGFYVKPLAVTAFDTTSVTVSFEVRYTGVLDHPRGYATVQAKAKLHQSPQYGGDTSVRPDLPIVGPTTNTITATFLASEMGMEVGFVRHETYDINVHTSASPGGNTDSDTFQITIP